MNCDEAFEYMTDPVLGDSSELKWHLDLCPRCRQMREVLAPALDLLAPSTVDNEDGDSTVYLPSEGSVGNFRDIFLSTESLAVAEQAAESLARQKQTEQPAPARRFRWGQLVAVCAMVAAVSIGALVMLSKPKDSNGFAGSNECLLMKHPRPVESMRQAGAETVIKQCQVCHNGVPK